MGELSRHDLYELCVQSPAHLVPLIRAIPGDAPMILGEDFAGTAALSHAWVRQVGDAAAIAVDSDAETLAYHGDHPRITRHVADVRSVAAASDVIFVGNFSIGYHHTRADLVEYLSHARKRLNPGGVFICDTYGGETAF